MATANSNRAYSARNDDFPLWFHKPSGHWCKTVKGQRFYFGKNKQAARREWLRVKDDLLAGRKPRPKSDSDTALHLVCNRFLSAKKQKLEAGELSYRQFQDLLRAAKTVTDEFGRNRGVEDLLPDDFVELRASLSARFKSPHSMRREIANIKQIFNHAHKNDWIKHPVKMGTDFKGPPEKKFREHRANAGKRLFTADQIHAVIKKAYPAMRAMILLAVNTGCNNSDLCNCDSQTST